MISSSNVSSESTSGFLNTNNCLMSYSSNHLLDVNSYITDSTGRSYVPKRHVLSSYEEESPNGLKFWIPVVPHSLQPKIGSVFKSYNECFDFYELYAEAAGFDVKRSSQNRLADGTVCYKVFRCTKSGISQKLDVDTLKVDYTIPASKDVVNRKSSSIKTGCEASLRCNVFKDGSCRISKFFEGHNHKLVSEINKNHLMKKRRLDFDDMQHIHDLSSRSNVGPSVAHRLKCDLSGGYEFVGPSSIDYKNFKRDINRFIGESDAHITIENLLRKKEVLPNFSCEYKCDDDGSLLGVFWADNISKLNYREFGDTVCFDATYGTNRYNMVFVPLTGVDNHKRCVIFGAALLFSESIESYSWFLDAFLKTFGKEPCIVATDQDPAMKEAINSKFKTAKHRLCMWHISNKLQFKVDHVLYSNMIFRKRMNTIFWNQEMTPDKFEKRWKSLIDDFSLHDKRWFRDMYAMKEMWMPCYFMDLPMNGLMRTSSLSESENSFFSKCKNKQSTLVEFFLRFEAAMEKQRHNNRLLEYEMENKSVLCVTRAKIERHAREVYTPTVFLLVQKEIEQSSLSCAQTSCVTEGDKNICVIKEKFDSPRISWNYKVVFHPSNGHTECSCLLFTREGRLCRHVFCVYNINDVDVIPHHHILRRWTKEASKPFNLLSSHFDAEGESSAVIKNLLNRFRKVVGCLKNDSKKLLEFRDQFIEFSEQFYYVTEDSHPSSSKTEKIQQLLGFSIPENVTIQPPKNVRNKGQRGSKRIVGAREKAITIVAKRRECKYCHKSGHNIRSCKQKLKDKMALVDEDEEDNAEEEDTD